MSPVLFRIIWYGFCMKILAIETSCDETSVAIMEVNGSRHQPTLRVCEHLVASQVEMHAKFGGVVPNLAKREHQRLLVPLTLRALKKAGMHKSSKFKVQGLTLTLKNKNLLQTILEREPELLSQFSKRILPLDIPDIDVIAVTHGPGLAPALWVGVNFAKALALVWKKSVIPMNHMKGHLYAAFVPETIHYSAPFQFPRLRFTVIALLVSGGHTELVLMKKFGDYKIIGETLDDAAGEAFDKVARMMKLGYPGGPAIAAEAAKFKNVKIESLKIRLPRPMISSKDYNFSFSGLKTAVLYALRDLPKGKRMTSVIPAMAKEFQDAVVDVLVAKTIRAAKEYGAKTIAVGGGVSANHLLRDRLLEEVKKQLPNAKLFLPHVSLTGDNALMIAIAAALDGKKKAPNDIGAEANLRLGN